MSESRIFNSENRFFSAMGKIADMLILNVLFIPTLLVGIGPACTALYYATMKNIRRSRGYASREYFRSFKINLKQGAICGILQLLFAILLYNCYYMAMSMDASSTFGQVYYAGTIVLILVFLFLNLYLYPILSRFNLSVGKLLKMSFTISIKHFLTTMGLLVMFLIMCLGIYVMPPLVFILPEIYTLCSTFLIERVFRRYMTKPEDASVDGWYYE